MSEEKIEVFRALRESQNRYVYFLLASVGAGIGFGIQQTSNKALSWSQTPLALSVIFWGLSFYFGCLHIQYVNSNLYANGTLLNIDEAEKMSPLENKRHFQAPREGIKEAIVKNNEWQNRYAIWQFRCLILGVVLYIAWHIYNMYLLGIK